jgi:uncharacterized membrane protein (DUF4010 family)
MLGVVGGLFEKWNPDLTQLPGNHPYTGLSLYVFCLGVMANIVSSRLHSLRRWPVYLATSHLILVGAVSHLWEGTLALSLAGQAIFVALMFNGLFRATWQQLHLPLKLSNATPLFALIVLVCVGWALLAH